MKKYDARWETLKEHEVPAWYEDVKLGIFIHWGLYSIPAFAPRTWELGEVEPDENWFCNNPYAEWYYNSVNVGKGPTYEHHLKTYGKDFPYEKFADMWKAEKWNPDEWAKLIKQSGAGYVVLTTKHHDGFCLYPSRYTDFHSGIRGPKRDLVGELTDAVKKENLQMGLYYSGMIDWQFANDPILKDTDNTYKACPTFAYADYAYQQSLEIIDRYHPSVFWNDIGWPVQGEGNLPYLLSHYYNTVEDGVVNDRFNGMYKDYATKEYRSGNVNKSEKWEMCRGLGLSFGYNANEGEEHLIPMEELVLLLVQVTAANGNLLLNIGPRADGTIPESQVWRLQELGRWLKNNGEGVYKTRCSSRESLLLESGVEVHFTPKDNEEFVFLGNLSEEVVNIHIPEVYGHLEPLQPEIEVQCVNTANGLRVTIFNYKKEYYTLGFCITKK